MEAFLRGWDNGRKRRSGRLAMTAIATAGVTAGGRDDARRAAASVELGADHRRRARRATMWR